MLLQLSNATVRSKLQHPPPRAYPVHLTPLPSRGGGNLTISLPGGGEFELHPRFQVKSLARQAIMGDAVFEDFRGKDCTFVANRLQGKGLNKLCAVFEGI